MNAINSVKSFWHKEWVRITRKSVFVVCGVAGGTLIAEDSTPTFFKNLLITAFIILILAAIIQETRSKKNKKNIPKQRVTLESLILSVVALASLSVSNSNLSHYPNPLLTFFVIFFGCSFITGCCLLLLFPSDLSAIWQKIRRK